MTAAKHGFKKTFPTATQTMNLFKSQKLNKDSTTKRVEKICKQIHRRLTTRVTTRVTARVSARVLF